MLANAVMDVAAGEIVGRSPAAGPWRCVRLEWVRSAEPPTPASGSPERWRRARVGKPCAWRARLGGDPFGLELLQPFGGRLGQRAFDRGKERALDIGRLLQQPLLPLLAGAGAAQAPSAARLRRYAAGSRKAHAASPASRGRARSRCRRAARRGCLPCPACSARHSRSTVRQAIRVGAVGLLALARRGAGFGRVMPVDGIRSQPAARKRASWFIEVESEVGAVDGNAIVVPQHDQTATGADARRDRSPHG